MIFLRIFFICTVYTIQQIGKLILPIPTARRSPAVVSLPTHLVVAGGNSSDYINIVEIYNVNNSQWSEADKLPRACEDQI